MTIRSAADHGSENPSRPLTFTVGDIRCQVISDGTAPYLPQFVFANVEHRELDLALDGRLDDNGQLSTPYHCLLLETAEATVLVDTGLGGLAEATDAPAGRLVHALDVAGYSPDAIDMVLLSHAHPDHIGGLLSDGSLTFSRARHVMSRTEWDFWTRSENLDRLPEFLAAPARALLPPLREADQLDLVDGDADVLAGVQLRPAPGHTPGHSVVTISSRGQQTTFLADAVLDDLNFAHPGWVSTVDHDPTATEHTRTRLLSEAAQDGAGVLAYHMSGLGHVERRGDGFAFVRESD